MTYRIGIDIGATTIKAGVINELYQIVKRSVCKTPDTFDATVKTIADMADDLAEQVGCSVNDFPCIGIGTPCSVVPETGRLVLANNTNWKDVSIKESLARYISIPIYVANDANCAIIGETIAGAAAGKKHVILVTLGTGVGSGIIINGKLFSGGDGLGAELGHVPIVCDGLACSCGLKGCLECYASATALVRQTKEAMAIHPESSLHAWVQTYGEVNGQTAFDCAASGDQTAIQVLDRYTSYLTAGLGGVINLFRPEVILIGGGISNAGDALLDRIRNKLPRYVLAYDVVGAPPVERAVLGNDAGMIGAAFLDQM